MKITISLILCFLLLSCIKQVDNKIETELLLDTDKEFANASLKHGAARAFMKYLTEDAIQMPQGQMPVYGNQNIFSLMKKSDDLIILNWDPQFAEVSDNADMGWTWGTYTVISKIDSVNLSYGKYLNVWKKQLDGTWKVRVDIGNSNPDPSK